MRRRGCYGNPSSLGKCSALDFALVAVPAARPGRSDHDPRQLPRQPELPARDGTDLQRQHRRRRSGPVHLQRADPEHPDRDSGRRAFRHRLRAALHRLRHHPDRSLSEVDMTVWGFPASNIHNPDRFPAGSIAGTRPAAPAWRTRVASPPPPNGRPCRTCRSPATPPSAGGRCRRTSTSRPTSGRACSSTGRLPIRRRRNANARPSNHSRRRA